MYVILAFPDVPTTIKSLYKHKENAKTIQNNSES